jgi:hypothetical protein
MGDRDKRDVAFPTNVYTVSLAKLAALIGCTTDQLYINLHKGDDACEIEGTLVLNHLQGEEIVFGVEEDEPKAFDAPRTTTALISAASRPGMRPRLNELNSVRERLHRSVGHYTCAQRAHCA